MADNPLTDPEAFSRWAENPLTQAFRAHLGDRVASIQALWLSEETPSAQMQAEQTRAGTWADLSSLSCDDVRGFYGLSEAEEANDE